MMRMLTNRFVVLSQFLVLVGVLYAVYWLASNTINNLASQGTASGFDFLDYRAGFGISQTLIEYSEDSSYGRVLLVGILNTLLVAFIGIFFASVLGVLLGVGRLSQNILIRALSAVYVELFRNVPLLLQIMFWYFGVLRTLPAPRAAISFDDAIFISNRGINLPWPVAVEASTIYIIAAIIFLVGYVFAWRWRHRRHIQTGHYVRLWPWVMILSIAVFGGLYALFGVPFTLDLPVLGGFNFKGGVTLIPELLALCLALSLYTAAFIAEIVRAGIVSVDRGQAEAARALGLPNGLTMRLILIPQALRVIIPPLTSQYLNLTKNSSLAVAIAYPDIVSVFAGTTLNQVGQAVEIIFITMVIYLSLSLLTSLIMNMYNRRVTARGGNNET